MRAACASYLPNVELECANRRRSARSIKVSPKDGKYLTARIYFQSTDRFVLSLEKVWREAFPIKIGFKDCMKHFLLISTVLDGHLVSLFRQGTSNISELPWLLHREITMQLLTVYLTVERIEANLHNSAGLIFPGKRYTPLARKEYRGI